MKRWDDERTRLCMKAFPGLYARNLGANVLGFAIVVTLNVLTPLEFFKILRTFIFLDGHWKVFFLFYPFVVCLVALLQYRVQAPIQQLAHLILQGEKIPDDLRTRGKERLVNLPFIIAFINLFLWIVVSALFVSTFYLLRGVPIKTCLFVYFRTVMIGLIAASLSFFLVEDYARKRLVPLFFPRGGLAAMPGTLRIPILRRIRLLYGAGTLNPMIILVGTFAFTAWHVKDTQIPIEDFLREIFFFTLVLCTIFVIISFKLNLLVQKSIQKPLGEMLGILGKVRHGDFTPRIKVFSNDEIGVLGDAGNAMLAGLQEMERIRDTFGKYVTPEIRDQILAGRIPVTGQRTEATLLFSDLRGFTTYVEENPPEEVISSMRTYFTAMERAIRNHDGLVLQYVGDEIEAVFGVPLRYDDHEDKAVMAALEMRKNLEALNTNRLGEGKEPFKHGIGIHTGLVLAGNTGSENRLSYALVGDTVNVASRIEGLTKKMDCDILVSEDTVRRFTNSFEMKEASSETLKGYSKPVTVYRVR